MSCPSDNRTLTSNFRTDGRNVRGLGQWGGDIETMGSLNSLNQRVALTASLQERKSTGRVSGRSVQKIPCRAQFAVHYSLCIAWLVTLCRKVSEESWALAAGERKCSLDVARADDVQALKCLFSIVSHWSFPDPRAIQREMRREENKKSTAQTFIAIEPLLVKHRRCQGNRA